MTEIIGILEMIRELESHGLEVDYKYIQEDGVYMITARYGDWYITKVVSEYIPFTNPSPVSLMQHNTERYDALYGIIKEFERVKYKEKENKMKSARTEQKFTRDDLKPGYIIKLRNGTFRTIQMVGRETLIATDGISNWEYLSRGWDIDMDSTDRGGKTFPHVTYDKTKDIVAVYGYVQGTEYYARESGCIAPDHRPLLWSRQEAKKMTVEEIENALGYKIEIVSD